MSGVVALTKLDWIDLRGLPGLTETHPSDRKAWNGTLRSAMSMEWAQPYTRDELNPV